MNEQNRFTKDIPSLHIVRVAAVLAIVLYHASFLINDRIGIEYPHFLFKFLYCGVDFLFVLSGFLFFYLYNNNFESGNFQKIWIFLKKRIIRIVPLYELLTLGLIVFYILVPRVSNGLVLRPEVIMKSIFFWPGYTPILIVGWTLSYQLYFYALFVLFLMKPTRPLFWMVMSLSFIVGLMQVNMFLFNYFNIEFLLGVVGAYSYIHYLKVKTPLLLSIGFLILIGAATADIVYSNVLQNFYRVFTYGVASYFIIWGIAKIKMKESSRVTNTIKILSVSSYAVFLTSYPFMAFLSLVIFRSTRFFMVEWFMIIGLAILFGFIIHRFVEQPLTSFFTLLFMSDKT